MKIRFKNDDCYFNNDELDELRENTKREAKQKTKQRKRFSEEEFYKQNKQRKK